jgi:hypothetical protein
VSDGLKVVSYAIQGVSDAIKMDSFGLSSRENALKMYSTVVRNDKMEGSE